MREARVSETEKLARRSPEFLDERARSWTHEYDLARALVLSRQKEHK